MKARALKIYDKFVKNGSQFEINISSALREEVVKKIKSGKFDLHMFDNVYKEISDMIKKDAFRECTDRFRALTLAKTDTDPPLQRDSKSPRSMKATKNWRVQKCTFAR